MSSKSGLLERNLMQLSPDELVTAYLKVILRMSGGSRSSGGSVAFAIVIGSRAILRSTPWTKLFMRGLFVVAKSQECDTCSTLRVVFWSNSISVVDMRLLVSDVDAMILQICVEVMRRIARNVIA